MRDQIAHVESARKNQPRHFILQREIRGIAADEVFFVETDGSRVQVESRWTRDESWNDFGTGYLPLLALDFRLSAVDLSRAFGMGEQQDLPGAADQLQCLEDGSVGRNSDDGRVQAAAVEG